MLTLTLPLFLFVLDDNGEAEQKHLPFHIDLLRDLHPGLGQLRRDFSHLGALQGEDRVIWLIAAPLLLLHGEESVSRRVGQHEPSPGPVVRNRSHFHVRTQGHIGRPSVKAAHPGIEVDFRDEGVLHHEVSQEEFHGLGIPVAAG